VGFNDFIKDDFIPEGDGQVAPGSASIPDPVSLETDEQTLQREQNERDVLEALVTNKPSHQPNGVCPKGPLFFFIPKSDSHADMHLQRRFSECSKQCYDRGLVSAMTGLVSAMTAV
jgi:hypothetical protein